MILGSSPAIEKLRDDISYAARADAKVLITGESGAGKELVARGIHGASVRSGGPFMAINCAGIPETLLESELFGFVRGSFTGAYRDRAGLLESGHRGTVFLDEVGEMTLRMQGLLLRFLETGEIQRIGADRMVQRLDVRIIAATNRPLATEVEEKRFRSDLYYRLNVIHMVVPPLRDRRDDVPVLLAHFLDAYGRRYTAPVPEVTPEAMLLLQDYAWPGNVRELKNVVERLIVRRHKSVTPEALPNEILQSRGVAQASDPALEGSRRNCVRESILDQLIQGRESFWSAVYDPFMARDLTREDLRAVVRAGLEHTRGSYTALTQLFNMDASDYKRFLNFLRKHQCHMPFHSFRMAPVRSRIESTEREGAA